MGNAGEKGEDMEGIINSRCINRTLYINEGIIGWSFFQSEIIWYFTTIGWLKKSNFTYLFHFDHCFLKTCN